MFFSLNVFLPLQSIYSGGERTLLVFISFISLVLIGFLLPYLLLGKNIRKNHKLKYSIKEVKLLINFGLILSFLGLGLSFYDKIFIQEIDFNAGLTAARHQMKDAGELRGANVSSIFSALGHLFSSGYFLSGSLIVLYREKLGSKYKVLGYLLVFSLLIIASALSAGRSSILLLAVFMIGAYGISPRRHLPTGDKGGNRLLGLIALSLLGIYILYIFNDRAVLTGVNLREYSETFFAYLGLKINTVIARFFSNDSPIYLILLALGYLSHSYSTSNLLLDSLDESKTIIFIHTTRLLQKAGLAPEMHFDWVLAGRFPSLPSALVYQFGYSGFILASVAIGISCGLASLMITHTNAGIFRLMLFLSAFSLLVISPLLLSFDFLAFPFVIISFLLGKCWLNLRMIKFRSI